MSDDDEGAPPIGLRVHTFGPGGESPKEGWDATLQPKPTIPAAIAAAMGVDPHDVDAIAAEASVGRFDMLTGRPAPGTVRFGPVGPYSAHADAAEARATRLKCLDLATQAVGAKDLGRLMDAARQLVAFVNDG